MPRKPDLLHVRTTLEWIDHVTTGMLDSPYVTLPPIYDSELRKIRLVVRGILAKHKAKGTRKDIRVEA